MNYRFPLAGLASIGFSFVTSAMAAPLPAHFAGTCTASSKYCAYFAPADMPIQAVGHYLANAKKSIRIATYNMDVRHFSEILKSAAKRGVKIEFLLDFDHARASSGDVSPVYGALASQPNVTRHLIPVMRGGNPQMHNKIIIIDGEILLMGSANFTYSGLVANYENVLAIRDAQTIQKFSDELDELRDVSQIACALFATPTAACGTGNEKWDAGFTEYVTTGGLPKTVVTAQPGCQKLTVQVDPKDPKKTMPGMGVLNQFNQSRLKNLAECVNDARYVQLAEQVGKRERFVDGTSTAQARPDQLKAQENQEVAAYFSPEDDVEGAIAQQLSATLAEPARSFAYISTNFITNTRLTDTLIQMKKAGVRLRVFFDAGREADPNFQQQLGKLAELGVTRGEEAGVSDKSLTILKNEITTAYGCVHNKFAVIGTPKGLVLVNGSANWSAGAMTKNDENLLVIKNRDVASIYLREVMSELFVYRYRQDPEHPGWKDDLDFVVKHTTCLNALMGQVTACAASESSKWQPGAKASLILSAEGVPAKFGDGQRVWAWVPQLNANQGGAVELFTYREEIFGGKWVGSISLPLGWDFGYKLLVTDAKTVPSPQNLGSLRWEYEGVGNDRRERMPTTAVHRVPGKTTFGRP
ncbi:MAG: phospholipase D-like domain-containing protein [Bacteriovoracia bacterium]